MWSWLHSNPVSAVSPRNADAVDLFRSAAEPSTRAFLSMNDSAAFFRQQSNGQHKLRSI